MQPPPTFEPTNYNQLLNHHNALIYSLLGERQSLVSGAPPVESQGQADGLEQSRHGLANKVLNGSVLLEDTGDEGRDRVDSEDQSTEVSSSLGGGGTGQHNQSRHGVGLQTGAKQRRAVKRDNTDVLLLSGKLLGGVSGLGSLDGVANDGGETNERGEVGEDGADGKGGGLDGGEVVERHFRVVVDERVN